MTSATVLCEHMRSAEGMRRALHTHPQGTRRRKGRGGEGKGQGAEGEERGRRMGKGRGRKKGLTSTWAVFHQALPACLTFVSVVGTRL